MSDVITSYVSTEKFVFFSALRESELEEICFRKES